MDESPEGEDNPLVVDIDVPTLQEISSSLVIVINSFNKAQYVDRRQSNGTWAPVFLCSLCTGTAKEEEFLERMIALDAEKNLG